MFFVMIYLQCTYYKLINKIKKLCINYPYLLVYKYDVDSDRKSVGFTLGTQLLVHQIIEPWLQKQFFDKKILIKQTSDNFSSIY